MRRSLHLLLALTPLVAGGWIARGSAPIETDPVTRLRAELAAGTATLEWEPEQGYLRAILRNLRIDPASQILVFSKTSLQSEHITRRHPRALYFDDRTYVGWIPGAPLIEIMSIHPTKGVVFTTIPNVAPKGKRSSFRTERDECVRCHGGAVPNLLARSVHAAPSGYARPFSPSYAMTPRLPIARRWGGWYVTGTHGAMRHMGNAVSNGTDEHPVLDPETGANLTALPAEVETGRYLTPHSDLVALMVLESQMDVQNAIVRAGLLARPSVDGDPATPEDVIDGGEPLVEALLGVDEARLTAPVAGTSGFAETYAVSGRRDRQGRALTELDLTTRLYGHGISPLIDSPSFEALPPAMHAYVGRRLATILSETGRDPRFAHLSPTDRRTLREMLRDLKPGLLPPD